MGENMVDLGQLKLPVNVEGWKGAIRVFNIRRKGGGGDTVGQQ
jgi:hypothetical protein